MLMNILWKWYRALSAVFVGAKVAGDGVKILKHPIGVPVCVIGKPPQKSLLGNIFCLFPVMESVKAIAVDFFILLFNIQRHNTPPFCALYDV